MELLDKCIDYIKYMDINDFVYRFYKISKVEDDYILNKLNLLFNDFIIFWSSLDNNNKINFIKVIETYDKNKKYKVKFPRNMITIVENGKMMLVLK